MALPRHRRQASRPANEPQAQHRLVSLWADLLSTLQQGAPGVATSAEEMADELPGHLVTPVNRELAQRGCSFRV